MTTRNGPEKRRGSYSAIILRLFQEQYSDGATRIAFSRGDIARVASELGISVPKNIGDVVYSHKYRTDWPLEITSTAPEGKEWAIRSSGGSNYYFVLGPPTAILPNHLLVEARLPDATPGVIAMYAKGDEQALLARLRYNRLLDVFTGIACYSLQNHLRTQVEELGQVETDEIYIGIDRRGAHYVLPVQAKGGGDRMSLIQIEQDIALCQKHFSQLTCKPIAAQFMEGNLIALFSFEAQADGSAKLVSEKHYRLVKPQELTADELLEYRNRND